MSNQDRAEGVNDGRHVEVLRAMGSVFKDIPSPCEEREAIEAALGKGGA